ncbi:MAG: acyltransferase [Alphaproteobacteria bacterium]
MTDHAKRKTVQKTFGCALAEAKFRPSGFDYMRILLALSVIFFHSLPFCYGQDYVMRFWEGPARPVLKLILPMFFILSGFLVGGSLDRSRTLVNFLGLRFIRIYPALIVEVVLSALLIGAALTSLPLVDYFSAKDFWRYMFNVTGHISYLLPGVFADQPFPNIVNVQLWTVPYELKCYIALAGIALLGVTKRKYLIFVIIVGMIFVDVLDRLDGKGFPMVIDMVRGRFLVMFFLCGVGLYLYRDKIPFSKPLFIVSVVLSVITLSHMKYYGMYLSIVPATYMTVYLGLCNPKRNWLSACADYSYGMFLYGAVIQQTIVDLFPTLREWYINIIISLPICFLIGWLSWHYVEKPMMTFRGKLKLLEENWIVLRARLLKRLRLVRT